MKIYHVRFQEKYGVTELYVRRRGLELLKNTEALSSLKVIKRIIVTSTEELSRTYKVSLDTVKDIDDHDLSEESVGMTEKTGEAAAAA